MGWHKCTHSSFHCTWATAPGGGDRSPANFSALNIRRRSRGRAPTPGTKGPSPKAQVPSSQGQKEGTLVSLEWFFNTIQAKYGNKHLEKLQTCVCVCQKSLIPIPYNVIIPLAPSPGRNPESAQEHYACWWFTERINIKWSSSSPIVAPWHHPCYCNNCVYLIGNLYSLEKCNFY